MSTSVKLPTNPLQGRRILVTRAAEQAAEFTEQLRQGGAVVVECPTIQLVPPEAWTNVDAAINDLSSFDWLILTSTNGVRFFFTRLQELGVAPTALQNAKVCAVGPKTAEAPRGPHKGLSTSQATTISVSDKRGSSAARSMRKPSRRR